MRCPSRLPTAKALLVAVTTLAIADWTRAQPPMRAPIRDPIRSFSVQVPDWLSARRRNIVMQRRDYSCGAAALATVVRYYWGDDVGEQFFLNALATLLTDEEAKDRVENGLAMSDLRRAAVKTGYQAVVGTLTFGKLKEARVPLIVGITVDGHDHFVVYRGTDGYWVYLADPIRGNIRVRTPEFLGQWQKNAVLAVHKPKHKVKDSSPLSVRQNEICLGQLNDQLMRTLPSRRINDSPRSTRR